MSEESAIVKLAVDDDGGQLVRLPETFWLPGNEVRVRRVGNALLLEPMPFDIAAWFAELDRFAHIPFMEEGRQQPPMPEPRIFFP